MGINEATAPSDNQSPLGTIHFWNSITIHDIAIDKAR